MSQIFSAIEKLKDKFKIRLDKVSIENKVFRLHSRVTVLAFFLSCGMVTMQQLIGNHIQCIVPPNEDIRQEALNQYCFVMSTYTLPHLYNESNVPHPGVGTQDLDNDTHHRKYHAYYQWVPFALFFQGLMFLLPHYLWKSWEGGRIKSYCDLELADKIPMKSRSLVMYQGIQAEPDKMINRAAIYFKDNLTYNTLYAYSYFICEILNFSVVVANIFLTDWFLGYEFSKYGHHVFSFVADDPESRVDPMDKVFPKVTKCEFQKFGPSGNIIPYDIMCVLALNIVNEKIYVALWLWFIILAIVGGLNIIYRILIIAIPNYRFKVMKRKILQEYQADIRSVLPNLTYGDWFLLKRLADNINRIRFGEFFHEIGKAIGIEERLSNLHSYNVPSTSKKSVTPDKLSEPDTAVECTDTG